MKTKPKTRDQLLEQIQELTIRLEEAEDALRAIREGHVDAVIVYGEKGENVFSLTGTDQIYRLLVETMNEGGLAVTPEGQVLFCNHRMADMLECSLDTILGRPMEEFVHPASRADLRRLLGEGHKRRARRRLVLQAANGALVPVQMAASPLALGDEHNICLVAADLREIEASEETCRQLGEQKTELVRVSENLRRSNQELEQFAYVASHDLQEPLRMVVAFTDLLSKELGDKLTDQTRQYMAFIHEGGLRMLDMVRDLLEFSRVDRQGQELSPVDLEEALQQAMEALRLSLAESGARVVHDPLPRVLGDKGQLAQIFQNLLSNAVKFRREGVTPEIRIQACREGPCWIVTVCDNGIGIDPRFRQRVFQIFQRLHTRDKYPGTGMGLSICKKIVERHGGTIWIEDAPKGGTTFRFTLPAGTIDH